MGQSDDLPTTLYGSPMVVDFQTEGYHQHRQDEAFSVNADEKSVSSLLTSMGPLVLGVICAALLALVVTCGVMLVWYRHRRRRRKLLRDLTFEGCEESKSIKSAPQSRSCSPKLNKRMSCPDALASNNKIAMQVRSMTVDRIPDFTLPPERVQPKSSGDTTLVHNPSTTGQSYQTIGGIKPDLYHHPSFSEEDEPKLPESSLGRLWFSVLYDVRNELLHVTLIKVKDLPGRGNNNLPRDPFVKIYLLPDEKTCKVTKSKKKTCSPMFNETHIFQISQKDVTKRVLRFSVYDVDKRRIRYSLGHVLINLKSLDLTKGDTMCCNLEPISQANSSLGEIQLSLVYQPVYEKIKIGIHQAKKLHLDDDHDHMGVYTKIQLYYGTKCHRMKRTNTLPCQTPPSKEAFFNESLSFTVNGRQLDSCNLVISLMFTSLNTYGISDVEYGRVVIGSFMYSRGEELVHWQEMVSHPKIATTRWHTIVNNAL